MSIPQSDHSAQNKAISCITEYVSLASLFVVLAGPWKHEEEDAVRDVRAWGQRGWCRMENLANSLSAARKTFIVAESATNVLAYGPVGIMGRSWSDASEVVGCGECVPCTCLNAGLDIDIPTCVHGRPAPCWVRGAG